MVLKNRMETKLRKYRCAPKSTGEISMPMWKLDRNSLLFDVEKKYNKMIGKIRVVIEHINSQLKTFRILSERYRNRRKRFGLRINLIAALVNRINFQ